MNTSISESSMTHQQVFTEWTSTLFSLDQERECREEEQEELSSETSRRSARKSQSNGSLRNSVALYSEQTNCLNFNGLLALEIQDNKFIINSFIISHSYFLYKFKVKQIIILA